MTQPDRIAHGELQRPGARQPLRLAELPDWHGWQYRSLSARVVRWIETHVRVPTGHAAGTPMRIAAFQRKIIRALYDSRAAVVSLPAGNGKTTLLAAIALERICRGDDYAEVAVVATKEDQAGQLIEQAKRMVEASPTLVPLCSFNSWHAMLTYRVTGSRMSAHPAKLSAVQGLNYSLAVVDEFGFADEEVVSSLIARVGKRPDATVVGIGTPGFEPNVMFRLREQRRAGELPPSVAWLEWSAPDGCRLDDKAAWRHANPGLKAGILDVDALALQRAVLDDASFRVYHLGQWVDGAAGWLPAGAWDACPTVPVPDAGREVVLAVEGTVWQTTAVVGCTTEGEVFYGWAKDVATDDELRRVLEEAQLRFRVREIVFAAKARTRLFDELTVAGAPVSRWRSADDPLVADELYRAVVERRVAHDHHPVVGEQMGRLLVRHGPDATIRLTRPESGWVDAALAVRMAWWRAVQTVELEAPAIF
jgi:phage terminase large subunit-like protein